MKKLIIALATLFCSALVIISILSLIKKPKENNIMPISQESYLIADYNGKIAVFENSSGEPSVVYEIYTHLLPENDIELLRKGIEVYTQEELQAKLEDFGL